jgi:hypothetical protein
MLGWQVLYHLSNAPSPFCFSLFSDSVLRFFQDWPQTANPPISAFQVAKIIGICHHAWLFTVFFKV